MKLTVGPALALFFGALTALNGGSMVNASEPPEPVEVRAELVSLKRTLDEHWGFGHHVSYQFQFHRSDVREATPDSGLDSDFPEALRPKLLYVSSEGVNRTMCDRPRYPHACELPAEEGKPSPSRVTLEVTFEDGLERTLDVDVPQVPSWGRPTIESLSQEGGYTLTFVDAGAAKYTLILSFYRGGHGNPFEEATLAELRREKPGDALVLDATKGTLSGYEVALERKEGHVVLTATKGVDGTWDPPGRLDLAAVCGEGTWPATNERPETWVRECDIHNIPQ